MFCNLKPLGMGLLVSAGLAGSAWAQDIALPTTKPEVASPFAFAQSKMKAARASEQTEQTSGARVLGGELADNGEWPWQVAFLISGLPVGPDSHFCGGSMILDNWVLTAAHCIHMQGGDGSWGDLAPQGLTVLVGSNKIAEGEGDLVPVEGIFRHPSYVGTDFDNDIALVKLARAPRVPYQTINVPTPEFGDQLDQPGVTTFVTGWGLTEGGNHPDLLREAQIQMMSRDMCNQMMLEARAETAAQGIGLAAQAFGLREEEAMQVWEELVSYVRPPMSENMLCSGSFEGGKTSCNGDSGGPLVVPLQDGTFIQAGVVSWGMSSAATNSCLETAMFSAYTRISNYIDWMNQTVTQN